MADCIPIHSGLCFDHKWNAKDENMISAIYYKNILLSGYTTNGNIDVLAYLNKVLLVSRV